MTKTILITGATGTTGKITAEYLHKCNYQCIITGRNEKTLNEMSEKYHFIPIKYDLNDLKNIESIFNRIKERNIKLNGFVHCAGISHLMKLEENNIEIMQETFNINLFSFIEAVKYFSKEDYSENNSSIVAISSITASCSQNRQTVYAATKGGLESMVRCAAKELMARKIRINTIQPGVMNTPMFEKLKEQSPNTEEKLKERYPLGIIEPEYIAYLTEYLLSDKSKYMTGSVIPADSGYEIWRQ